MGRESEIGNRHLWNRKTSKQLIQLILIISINSDLTINYNNIYSDYVLRNTKDLLSLYTDVFYNEKESEVLKPMSGGPASIELIDNGNRIIPTKILVPRKIEINRQSAAKEAIGKLVRQGILEKVPDDVVTDWISPCSFVSKDG